MNPIAEEIKSYYGSGSLSDEEFLEHYGMPRRSGRYPWGSGDDPYQRTGDFIGRVEELRKSGFKYIDDDGKTWTGDTAIAKSMGLSSTEFRTELGIAKSERRMLNVARAQSLKDDGLSNSEIGRRMGVNESTVRSWFDEKANAKMNEAKTTAEFLKAHVDKKGMVDVGSGVNQELNISKERMDQALYLLKREGYEVYGGRFSQATNPGQKTTQKILCKPGTDHKDIYDLDKIQTVTDYISRDDGKTFEKKFNYPSSLDSKRLMIRYSEDGGIDKDGIVELRRNVPDLSLGDSRYSQVRIMVDGTHYIKGMAVYSDNMPDGVDVIFNTNKTKGTPMTKVLKEIKDDPDNPFGSLIKDADQGGQYWYDADTGKRVSANDPTVKNKKLGLINKRADEGDWTEWKDALPSQFLSKQSTSLAKKQLDLAKADKLAEYEEYCSITNPTIKKHYLQKFAESCDSAAVHLQAAALPGQKYHVIIPINTLKDNEIYAPGYKPGTKLALVRYPHGGTFEIPILTVTDKNPLGKKVIGTDVMDAVGINKKVADRLSGADFDGDTVMCLPTNNGKVKITSTKPLEGLEGFDPKMSYGPETYKGRNVKLMTKGGMQQQMGVVSNLITDMTLAGAEPDEIARAVRHSMVVIDAYKHKLDYKQSEIDNNIAQLKKDYQNGGGSSTIISRAKSPQSVDKRQGTPKVNMKGKSWYDPSKPEGALIYKKADDLYYVERVKYDKDTGDVTYRTASGKKLTYNVKDKDAVEKYKPIKRVDPNTGDVTFTNKAGDITYRTKTRTQDSSKMAEASDAYSLVSDARHPMELIYADYANSMKAMANQARKEMMSTKKIEYSKSAKFIYQKEVDALDEKLRVAELNKGRERAANRKAVVEVQSKVDAGLLTESGDIKKARQQSLAKYRQEVGSVSRKDRNIKITDKEWEAIQAGAITESKLKRILDNADADSLRERATPKTYKTASNAQVSRMKSMAASGYTLAQIADKMGLSTSTVSKYLKGVN